MPGAHLDCALCAAWATSPTAARLTGADVRPARYLAVEGESGRPFRYIPWTV
jgi:hypothetical protein